MANIIHSFDAVIDDDSRVLILGTIPGPESLEMWEYYAAPRNQFWKTIFGIFGKEEESEYDEKIAFLLSKKIAVWDTLKSGERTGAKDSQIKNEIPNKIKDLLKRYKNVRCIFFNGVKAQKFFKKHKLGQNLPVRTKRLPSTSGVNTRLTVDEKIDKWKTITDFLS